MRRVIPPFQSIALAIAVAVAIPVPSPAADPVFAEVTVHDPSVVRDAGTYYVFGSHLASASSPNLLQWTQLTTGPVATNPLAPNPQIEFQEAIAWVGAEYAFWAPDVIKLPDGRYAYYYCIGRLDQPRAALGVAFSSSITGPYKHDAVLLRSGAGGQPPEAGATYDPRIHPNTVDPALFYDRDGQLWMVYGSYSGGIFILKMDATTGRPIAGQGYGRKLWGGEHARIEGAYVLYHPVSDYYYLFVSYGGLGANDGYNIRLGRSRQPDGPYRDAADTDLATVAGAPGSLFDDTSIAPHGVKLMGNYQFLAYPGEPRTFSRGYRSPGHNSAFRDAATGRSFLVFHTRFVGRGEQHEVRVHQLFLNADHWLVVAPHRYAGEALGVVGESQVSGTYKLINHGKAISSTVTPSVTVTLHANRAVTGATAGSWQLSDGHQLTLVLGATTYRGVCVRQWDDDQRVWVLGFTALSADGTAVWGSKLANEPLPSLPAITAQPAGVTLGSGSIYTLQVRATGPDLVYQWSKDGVALAGAQQSSLTFAPLSPADAGTFRVTVSNPAGQVTSEPAMIAVISPQAGRLTNLSVRSRAGRDSATLIMGFVVTGNGSHPLLIRGLGPRLLDLEVAGALADPQLRVFTVDRVQINENDDWPDDLTTTMASVGALPLTPGAKDAALLVALPAGSFTAHVTGAGPGTGVAVAECYDAGLAPGARLINVSARSHVGTGEDVLIAGFYLSGNVTRRLLIRAMGPSLAPYGVSGVLQDPELRLFNADRVRILENDNWGGSAALEAAFAQVGAFPPVANSSKDAALVVDLVPGLYTVHVAGVGDTTGVALVEVYELP
jgi:beta-xylosidase